LNRYIDGGRKRDQTMDLAWYRKFVTQNTVSSRMEASRLAAQGCLCISFITGWISQTARDES